MSLSLQSRRRPDGATHPELKCEACIQIITSVRAFQSNVHGYYLNVNS
jgi:hypothetical protein